MMKVCLRVFVQDETNARYRGRRLIRSIYPIRALRYLPTSLRSAHFGKHSLTRHARYQLRRQDGKAYNCFCTPDEAQAIKLSLKSQGDKRNYDGRCSHLTEEDVGRRKRAGHKHVVRFKVDPFLLQLIGID